VYPDTRISPLKSFCTVTDYQVRQCLYRDTAQVGLDRVYHRDRSLPQFSLYRDYAHSHKVCTMMAKTAPCLASDGLTEIVTKAKDSVNGLWSLVTKNVFYCRAVRYNSCHILTLHFDQIQLIFITLWQMTTRDQILNFISENRKMLLERFHITKIGLFGSYARGEQKDSSDIDLLVEFEENTQDLYDLKLQLKEFFKENFGIETDICREKYIKPRLKRSILKETVYA
jgi:predicted nucleotidyltransferase